MVKGSMAPVCKSESAMFRFIVQCGNLCMVQEGRVDKCLLLYGGEELLKPDGLTQEK